MHLTPDQAANAVERNDCPKCEAPAGSPCRTRAGKTTAKYHTPRFILVPALREELEVLVPDDRGPGRPWKPGPPVEQTPAAPAAVAIRIGYARCSTAQQELQSQLDALEPLCKLIFSEKISTRVKVRPELEKALRLAYDIKEAAPDQEVILTVHELKRLARNAAELMTLSGQLQSAGVQLELLTGPLTGIHDPNGMGAMFFAVLAAAAQIERNYIREKTLEGQVVAASKGNHGGRPKVIDDDSLLLGLALKDRGVPRPRDREEADHQDRQERRRTSLRRLRVPGARRGRRGRRPGRSARGRSPPAGPRPDNRSRQRHRPGADGTPHPAGSRRHRRPDG
ncbi:recombinase family protein [Streptomyces nigra]|uniref:recombinase family protein n=1 Tax=Streptomyces nigra TaxID=1827580 RepID=UPI00368554B5